MRETVVLLGNFAVEHRLLDPATVQFGWSLKSAKSISRLGELSSRSKVVAVISDLTLLAGSWEGALKAIRDAAPGALPIVCQRFSDTIAWPELAAAGAFHAISLPLNPGEVRQSLGFVWASRQHRAPVETTTEIYALERSLTVLSEPLVV